MARSPLLFNPAVVRTDELETVLVGREEQLQIVADDLREQRDSKTKQHFLIIGPRGIGKTHLAEVLARRLSGQGKDGWRTARLPEESFSIDGLRGLLAAVVDRDAGAARCLDAPVPGIEASVETLLGRQNETGKPLLVILENLPRIIKRVLASDREVSRLRSLLMHDPPFTLLATATGYFDDVLLQDRPLYDFFRVIMLRELTGDQIEELVARRANWDGVNELMKNPNQLRRRVRALHHLSGGNPRLALVLYEALRNGLHEDILWQLLEMLDRVTPYYQVRMEGLSRQQALVLARLSAAPGPMAPSRLARLANISTSHATAVLNVLLAERFTKRVPGPHRGRRLCAVTDRLLRIWLEMRESCGARRRVGFLVKFYETAYSLTESAAAAGGRCSCRNRPLPSEPVSKDQGQADEVEAWEQFACERAHQGDVRGFASAAAKALRQPGETADHLLCDTARSLRGSDEPESFRQVLSPIFANLEPSSDEVLALFEGLWTACEGMTLGWVIGVVKLFEKLAGEAPEPWNSLAEIVPSELGQASLATLHPEIKEAVELILGRLGIEIEPALLADG